MSELTAFDLQIRLAAKYAAPSWAYFREIKSEVGYSSRRCDGLAMAMWRSLGLQIIGFEIKTSRSDWMRELKDASKSEAIFKYCDRWFLVVSDEGIVHPGELPDGWGLLVPSRGGLKQAVQAAKLTPLALTRDFVAEVLRHAVSMPATEKERAEYQRGLAEGRRQSDPENDPRLAAHERLVKMVDDFQAASGISITDWRGGKAIGNAVRMVLDGRAEQFKRDLQALLGTAKRIHDQIEREVKDQSALKLEGAA